MPKSKRRTGWKAALFTLLALGVAGAVWLTIARMREKPVLIQVEPVKRRNITEYVVASGRIQPVTQVVINPEVSGEIIELPIKEGQQVRKGDLIVKIKPDNYIALTNSAHATYRSALAAVDQARANREKAELEHRRSERLFAEHLISDSQYLEAKTAFEMATAAYQSSTHQVEQARASMAKALDDLLKTVIVSPLDGTITKLKSQLGERVVGSVMMQGTEMMTIANLDEMEARVDVGESDVVLIAVGQKARLEVDAFRDRKFAGAVTDIGNSSKTAGSMGGGSAQEATKFEVRVRIQEKERFRPGMSVTAEIETRYRTNVLAVPNQSVTTRLPKAPNAADKGKSATGTTNAAPGAATNAVSTDTNAPGATPRKPGEAAKPIEVVFVHENGKARMLAVKRGISDDTHVEIVEGLKEGQEVVSGGYKAINRELEEGKAVKIGSPPAESDKEKK